MQIRTPDELRQFYAAYLSGQGGDWPDFELLIQRLYEQILQPGEWAVDGGACFGRHAFPMARLVGTAGRVEAFEPISRRARLLHLRASRERIIRVHQLALSDHSGEADFLETGDPGYSGLRRRLYPSPDMPVTPRRVRTATLDEVIPADAPVRFIKLDLEGGEYHALRGGERLIVAQRPVIVFEYDRSHTPGYYGFTHEDLLAYFDRLDYRLSDILGVDLDNRALWEACKVWYFIATPRERTREHGALL